MLKTILLILIISIAVLAGVFVYKYHAKLKSQSQNKALNEQALNKKGPGNDDCEYGDFEKTTNLIRDLVMPTKDSPNHVNNIQATGYIIGAALELFPELAEPASDPNTIKAMTLTGLVGLHVGLNIKNLTHLPVNLEILEINPDTDLFNSASLNQDQKTALLLKELVSAQPGSEALKNNIVIGSHVISTAVMIFPGTIAQAAKSSTNLNAMSKLALIGFYLGTNIKNLTQLDFSKNWDLINLNKPATKHGGRCC